MVLDEMHAGRAPSDRAPASARRPRPWRPSRNQRAALRVAVADPRATSWRSLARLLRLDESTLYRWRRDPRFRRWWTVEAARCVHERAAAALPTLRAILDDGNRSALSKLEAVAAAFDGLAVPVFGPFVPAAVLFGLLGKRIPRTREALRKVLRGPPRFAERFLPPRPDPEVVAAAADRQLGERIQRAADEADRLMRDVVTRRRTTGSPAIPGKPRSARAAGGLCPFGRLPGEADVLRKLRRLARKPPNRPRPTWQHVANEANLLGLRSRSGRLWSPQTVRSALRRAR